MVLNESPMPALLADQSRAPARGSLPCLPSHQRLAQQEHKMGCKGTGKNQRIAGLSFARENCRFSTRYHDFLGRVREGRCALVAIRHGRARRGNR